MLIILTICLIGCTSTPNTPIEPEEWDIDMLKAGEDLSSTFSDFFIEINKMRTDPKKYASYHRRDLPRNIYKYLLSMEPLPPLIYEEGLSKAAEEVSPTIKPGVSLNLDYIWNTIIKYGNTTKQSQIFIVVPVEIIAETGYRISIPGALREFPNATLLSSSINHIGLSRYYDASNRRSIVTILGITSYIPKR